MGFNLFHPDTWFAGTQNPGVGPQQYFGGSQDASTAATNRYQGLASAAQGQAAPQANYGGVNNTLQSTSAGVDTGLAGVNQLNKDAAAGYTGANTAAQGALSNLATTAAGKGPTAADSQLSAGTAAALQAQLAAAASAKGGAYGQALAGEQAGQTAANTEAQNAGQAAQLRAKEIQAAQQALVQGTQGEQGQLAGEAAQQTGTALGATTAGGQFGLGVGQLQAGDVGTNAALQEQQNQLNNTTGLGYEQLGYNVGAANLGAGDQAKALEAGANSQNAGTLASLLGSGIGAAGGAAMLASDVTAKTTIEPQGAANPASGGTAISMPPPTQPGETASAQSAASPMDQNQSKAFAQSLITSGSNIGKGSTAQYANTNVSAFAPAMSPITSDEDTKRDVQHTHVADSYLDQLARSASTFSYKSDDQQPVSIPRPHGARFGGVMAQDLERVPEIGHQLVTDTPRGKTLEGGSNLSAALMGLGRLAQRVAELEGRR